MWIVALLLLLSIGGAGILLWLLFGPFQPEQPEPLFMALFALSAIAGAGHRLLIARFAPHWSPRRGLIVASAMLPGLFLLVFIGFDVGGAVYHHWFDPDGPFMVGISIMLFPVCIVAFGVSLIAAGLVRRPR